MKPRDEHGSDTANNVSWAADVIDNEHMDKKSSKACCIFHKARAFAESDSEESDSDWDGFDDRNGNKNGAISSSPTPEVAKAT